MNESWEIEDFWAFGDIVLCDSQALGPTAWSCKMRLGPKDGHALQAEMRKEIRA